MVVSQLCRAADAACFGGGVQGGRKTHRYLHENIVKKTNL